MSDLRRQSRGRSAALVWAATLVTAAALGAGCAKVPKTRYGVNEVRIEGTKKMSDDALEGCLGTRERPHVTATFGVETAGACGEPPFDADPPRLRLWAWPWTDWPLFDRIVLEQDLLRIDRWFEARGFHHAEVTDVQVEPAEAFDDDSLPEDGAVSCERLGDDQGCELSITISVDEGTPTLVEEVRVTGIEGLPSKLRTAIEERIAITPGSRFDEALYEQGKRKVLGALGERGYARAKVRGVARVDRSERKAWIDYTVDPGPVCVFGDVGIEGHEDLPPKPIIAAAYIPKGDRFDPAVLDDAQRAIYGLGAFAAVSVEPVIPDEGNVIDIRLVVTPDERTSWELGGGLQGGEFEGQSVNQWDVHLSGRFRRRNFLGGLRQLTIDEKPRLVFQNRFPTPATPRFGNRIKVELRQPGVFEPRTGLVTDATHVYGPDPYVRRNVFFRQRFDFGVRFERTFFGDKLYAQVGLRNSIYRPVDESPELPSDYETTYFEQIVRLDLRDDPARPHKGIFVELGINEAGYFLPLSSWDYIRLLPDFRFYIPFPRDITLAGRFALGLYFITGADNSLDPRSAQLGPRDLRLFGGGASSNRGFLPATLGDVLEGGTRRWESSLELRIPVTTDLGLVWFGDAGDVSRAPTLRFDHPQAATGFGLRYYTLIGAVRLDFAWRIRKLQVLGEDERIRVDVDGDPVSGGGRFVFHLTIGESF